MIAGPLPNGFDPATVPVWLWSSDGRRVLFASRAALVICGVRDLEALTGHIFGDAVPATRRLAELGQSQTLQAPPRLERLRFYFNGRAETLTCLCKLTELASGGQALLVAAFGVRAAPHSKLRESTVNPFETTQTAPPALSQPRLVTPAAAAAPQTIAWLAQPSAERRPVRFTWASDADGRLLSLSAQFAAATGLDASTFVGRSFADILSTCDAQGLASLKDLAQSRETWTAASVAWQVPGQRLIVPVDISGVPNFDLTRRFQGFRGFGVLRVDRARMLPPLRAPGQPGAAQSSAPEPPPPLEAAVPEAPMKPDSQVVPFRPARPAGNDDGKVVPIRKEAREPPPEHSSLSIAERQAFREIARALGARIDGEEIQPGGAAADSDPETSAQRVISPAKPAGDQAARGSAPAANPDDDALDVQWNTPPADSGMSGNANSEKSASDAARAPAARNPLAGTDNRPAPAIHLPQDTVTAIGKTLTAASSGGASAERPPAPVTVLSDHAAERDAAVKSKRQAETDAILDRVPVGVLVLQAEEPVYANRTLLDLLGWPTLESLIRDGGPKRILQGRSPAMLTAAGPAIVIAARDGEKIAVDGHVQSSLWRDRPATLMTFRRAIENGSGPKLQALELDLLAARAEVAEARAILDTATDGVIGLDEKGRILKLNRPAEALFGYTQNEIAGEAFTALLSPESHPAALDYFDGLKSHAVAALLNDGREVTGRERKGGRMPLFMTIGRAGGGAFAVVLRDITQWKRSEAELVDAKRLAEKASAQKSDFLAKVSHEVRTPLNAIIGFAEVMMDERLGPVGNERYREYLRDIHMSGGHVMSLVNDLLDLSKIEAGKMELAFTSVDLNAIVSSCLSIMQPQASRDKVIVRTHLTPRLPKVVADERSIRQIVLNVLSNATKFTDAGGQVIVSTVFTDRGEALLRIRDTGIGMSDKEIEIALQPFRRLTTASPRTGTGLGLPLTKALTEANRAHFSISSKPREGTMVEITFPSMRVLAE